MNILVTGASGQLGSELHFLSNNYPNHTFTFTSREQLDITSEADVFTFFQKNNFNYCINGAAYTAVDKAESDFLNAEKVNTVGAKNIASACKKLEVILIHVSTDFVFDGNKNIAYLENDKTEPINVYGTTKLKGELAIQDRLTKYFILRTSWLYSSYGNNFVKTMQRLGKEKKNLSIVSDQIGTPTYARDLAKVILTIIETKNKQYGTYHYSNEGKVSWYAFAEAIFDYSNITLTLNPITTAQYPTAAKRPSFSVMNKNKIKNNLNICIPHWTDSLKQCITLLK